MLASSSSSQYEITCGDSGTDLSNAKSKHARSSSVGNVSMYVVPGSTAGLVEYKGGFPVLRSRVPDVGSPWDIGCTAVRIPSTEKPSRSCCRFVGMGCSSVQQQLHSERRPCVQTCGADLCSGDSCQGIVDLSGRASRAPDVDVSNVTGSKVKSDSPDCLICTLLRLLPSIQDVSSARMFF